MPCHSCGSGVPFALCKATFNTPSRGPFDSVYMSALFQLGENLGKSATPFGSAPPPYPGPPALPVQDPQKTGAN